MKLSELICALVALLAEGEDGEVWCEPDGVYMQAEAEVRWLRVSPRRREPAK